MIPSPVRPAVALSIAGSDCSAGAGLQADLKTFAALGVYGLTAVTCVVAEIPGKVSRIQAVEAEVLASQLDLLLSTFPVAAIKTGMLFSAANIRLVADALHAIPEAERPWLVVDPVMVATSGDVLIEEDAVAAYRKSLFPLADLVTPNMDEAAALLGRIIETEEDLEAAARELSGQLGVPMLLKGGHLGSDLALDVFQPIDGTAVFISTPFIRGVHTHGTGCTYSAAIAAGLAKNQPMTAAIRHAKDYVTATITTICRWDAVDALNHSALK